MLIYTIGYGNRAITDFINLLDRYQVELLIDTRSVPYSRFRPNYRKQALQAKLEQAGLQYLYLGDALGGRPKDPECYVKDESGADVIDPARVVARPDFITGLERVVKGCHEGLRQALMCAELRPQDCHRSRILGPELEARGVEVLHIDEQGDLKTQFEVRGWFANT